LCRLSRDLGSLKGCNKIAQGNALMITHIFF